MEQPTTSKRLHDNSSLSSYKRCPRLYYFEYDRQWRPDGTRAPLAFGGSWGDALDAVWTIKLVHGGSDSDAYDAACEAFLKSWTEEYSMPGTLTVQEAKELGSRTPATAYRMLADYIPARQQFWQGDTELIGCEVPFEVPLPPTGDSYVGLFDKLVRHKGKVLVVEHKTTGLYKIGGPFRSTFTDSFSPNSQIDGYLFAISKLFPEQSMPAVWVDGSLVHANVSGFAIIPIEKRKEQLAMWAWEVTHWAQLVEFDKTILQSNASDSSLMYGYARNTGGCFAFNSACSFIDLCRGLVNPSLRSDTPPGFKVSDWNPLKRGLSPVLRVPVENV